MPNNWHRPPHPWRFWPNEGVAEEDLTDWERAGLHDAPPGPCPWEGEGLDEARPGEGLDEAPPGLGEPEVEGQDETPRGRWFWSGGRWRFRPTKATLREDRLTPMEKQHLCRTRRPKAKAKAKAALSTVLEAPEA